jgi:hypothetical protein
MTKLIPIFIDGEKWVQLSQLTLDQAKSLKTFLPVNSFKKIFLNGMELCDCIDFDSYEIWFRSKQVPNPDHALLDF